MKRLGLVLLVVLISSCVGAPTVKSPPVPTVVQLDIRGVDTVQVEDTKKIAKSMEIPHEGGEFSSTFIEDGQAYMDIYLSITPYTAKEFWNDITLLELRGIKDITLYLSSSGGSAFAGLALADQIEIAKKKGFRIEAHASGVIASATVPVFAVCSKRYAAEGTIFMVHEASMFKYFSNESKSDIKAQGKLMDLLTTKYMNKLTKYSHLTIKQWEAYEKDTTWFDVEQAKKWGLVDEIE